MKHHIRTDRARCLGRAVALGSLSLALAFSSAAAVQVPPRRPQANADSARLAADLFFRAVADERWNIASAMVDTTLMHVIVAQRLRWQPQSTHPELTLEDEFAGVKSLLELARLSPVDAAARYLEAQDVREQARAAGRRGGCADSLTRVPANLRRILGVALAADTIAYVLHEDAAPPDDAEGLPHTEPMVMQLRLRGAQWTIIPGSALLRSPGAAGFTFKCDSLHRPTP